MKVYWHYYIFDSAKLTKECKITTTGRNVIFKKPELVSLSIGKEAYLIASLNSEVIEESYDFSLFLKGILVDTNKEFSIKLPYPNANHISIDKNYNKCANVYFNL